MVRHNEVSTAPSNVVSDYVDRRDVPVLDAPYTALAPYGARSNIAPYGEQCNQHNTPATFGERSNLCSTPALYGEQSNPSAHGSPSPTASSTSAGRTPLRSRFSDPSASEKPVGALDPGVDPADLRHSRSSRSSVVNVKAGFSVLSQAVYEEVGRPNVMGSFSAGSSFSMAQPDTSALGGHLARTTGMLDGATAVRDLARAATARSRWKGAGKLATRPRRNIAQDRLRLSDETMNRIPRTSEIRIYGRESFGAIFDTPYEASTPCLHLRLASKGHSFVSSAFSCRFVACTCTIILFLFNSSFSFHVLCGSVCCYGVLHTYASKYIACARAPSIGVNCQAIGAPDSIAPSSLTPSRRRSTVQMESKSVLDLVPKRVRAHLASCVCISLAHIQTYGVTMLGCHKCASISCPPRMWLSFNSWIYYKPICVLLFCCSVVLLFCCSVVLLFCCSVVLLFSTRHSAGRPTLSFNEGCSCERGAKTK